MSTQNSFFTNVSEQLDLSFYSDDGSFARAGVVRFDTLTAEHRDHVARESAIRRASQARAKLRKAVDELDEDQVYVCISSFLPLEAPVDVFGRTVLHLVLAEQDPGDKLLLLQPAIAAGASPWHADKTGVRAISLISCPQVAKLLCVLLFQAGRHSEGKRAKQDLARLLCQ